MRDYIPTQADERDSWDRLRREREYENNLRELDPTGEKLDTALDKMIDAVEQAPDGGKRNEDVGKTTTDPTDRFLSGVFSAMQRENHKIGGGEIPTLIRANMEEAKS